MKKKIRAEAAIRHQKANELLNEKPSAKVSSLSEDEAEKLIYGLEAHRIELEMQNEELVQARTAALETFEKYTELYDFAPYGYFSLSKEGRIIELNLCGSQMLGKVRTLLKNSLFGFFVSDDTKPVFNNFLGKVFDNKTKETCEVTLSTRNNSPKYVSLTGIVTEKGEQCLVTAADITEHKQAEVALQESESRSKAMYEAIPDLMFRLDRQGVFLDYIANEKDLYTQTNQTIIGKSSRDIFPREFADFIDRQIQITLTTKTLQTFEYKLPIPCQGVRDYEARMVVSGPDEVTAIVRDITERKKAEQEIIFKNEELQKTNAEKDKFFSIIAHDLRGPLGSFMEMTEMMAGDSQDFTPDQKKHLTLTMSHSARNIFNLLENLLEWSKMQRGSTAFNPQRLGLKEVISECLKSIVESARKKAIDLVVDIPGEQKVFADVNMLQTVIRNLVSNAVKFTAQGGKVTIKASPGENNMAVIAVKDNGIGMSKDMLDNLFRIDAKCSRRGTEDEPGTGLGLLLCKEFIEKHDGRIWAESEENNGSTFYFTLPAERVKVSKG